MPAQASPTKRRCWHVRAWPQNLALRTSALPNNAMKLTRCGLVAGRSVVEASRHGVVATKDHGAVVRPSQLIASVGLLRG